jgi:hypothetical protein
MRELSCAPVTSRTKNQCGWFTGTLCSADPLAKFEQADIDRKRALVDALLTVTFHPVRQCSKAFRPEAFEITWRVESG